MAAFLEKWNVPHEKGVIESEDYQPPDEAAVEQAVNGLEGEYPLRRILLYLATVGLLMGDAMPAWREATWPVVDRRVSELS
jgi:hypothetical protein